MQLNVLITASPIPSHPRIDIVKETILSLGNLKYHESTVLESCKIVIAHDAARRNSNPYETYLANLLEWVVEQNYDIEIVVADEWGCLVGNIRHGFQFVTSEYVLIVQHDMPFRASSSSNSIDMFQVIQDMKAHPELKCVRFNKRKNTKTGFDAVSNLFGEQLKAQNYVYTRTPAWSDNNHLCKSVYYTDIVLKECKDGQFMEKILHPKAHKNHAKYGMYLYGPPNAPACIAHTDGRNKK